MVITKNPACWDTSTFGNDNPGQRLTCNMARWRRTSKRTARLTLGRIPKTSRFYRHCQLRHPSGQGSGTDLQRNPRGRQLFPGELLQRFEKVVSKQVHGDLPKKNLLIKPVQDWPMTSTTNPMLVKHTWRVQKSETACVGLHNKSQPTHHNRRWFVNTWPCRDNCNAIIVTCPCNILIT